MNFSNDQISSTASIWAPRGIGALVAAAFFGSGIAKLGHVSGMVDGLTHAEDHLPQSNRGSVARCRSSGR